jgi:hypothetical protein
VDSNSIFVGESAHRLTSSPGSTASFAVLHRTSWKVLDRVPLPCSEIYDLLLVPRSLLDGLRRGFDTNPLRRQEHAQQMLFDEIGLRPHRLWATADPLPPEACRVRIEASVPEAVRAESVFDIECSVTNLGAGFLVSAPPNPVHLSYKWIPATPAVGVMPEGYRTALPRTIPPAGQLTCQVRVLSPRSPGDFVLRLTVVQESVAWFDDLDPANGCSREVRILPRPLESLAKGGGTRLTP